MHDGSWKIVADDFATPFPISFDGYRVLQMTPPQRSASYRRARYDRAYARLRLIVK